MRLIMINNKTSSPELKQKKKERKKERKRQRWVKG